MPARGGAVRVDEEATRALVARARALLREHDAFAAAEGLARLAGAQVHEDHAEFGFWVPDAADEEAGGRVEVELLTPLDDVVPGAEDGIRVSRQRLEMEREGDWAWLAVRGSTLGSREVLGTLYRIVCVDADGREVVRTDPLAASLPYGVHGPGELYDLGRMHAGRADADFFRRVGIGGEDEEGEPPRLGPPAHVLEMHVGTATHGGTLADLADLYRALADKVRDGVPPTPAESAFLGYDAVELLPLEPQAAPAAAVGFEVRGEGDEAVATLRPPRTIDWGYDVALLGSAAIEPSLLRSGRPDELVDLAAVLHTFPGKPIRLVLDLVFGHAHDAARDLLPEAFFRDEGEFGPRPDLTRPAVRALLKEMQRRKVDYGADGVRVDAAHDLRVPAAPGGDGGAAAAARGEAGAEAGAGGLGTGRGRPGPEDGDTVIDDRFLAEMADVVQSVADVRYRPFMIFEDGRPDEGGRRGAPPSYRAVLRDRPDALAWGPLTYADAEPFLSGFWGGVGWRLDEIASHGGHWVQGYANHDTLRRAYRRRTDVAVNPRLGGDLPEILRRAYDHAAADLMFYGLLPGVPMTFLQAGMRAPWAFFRNVPTSGLPSTAANEADVLAWRFTAEDYAAEGAFSRLKSLGLGHLDAARDLFLGLRGVVARGAHDPEAIASAAAEAGIPLPEPGGAESAILVSRAFMEDLRDACVVWRSEGRLDEDRARTARDLRRIRRERPWLAHDLRERDRFDRRVNGTGGVLAWGLRHAPDGSESLGLLANLEGEPWTVVPEEVLGPGAWELLLRAPSGAWEAADRPVTLHDAEGLLVRSEG